MKLLILLASVVVFAHAEMQNITVIGHIVCNHQRVGNLKVSLKEDDMFSDDELAYAMTNSRGSFKLFGEQDEWGFIDPIISITHSCNTPVNCTRTNEYPVPRSLVGSVYDMKSIVLNVFVNNNEPRCA